VVRQIYKQLRNLRSGGGDILAAKMSRFGPPFRRKKSEKPGPKNQKSGHGPLFPDHVRTFCFVAEFEIGGDILAAKMSRFGPPFRRKKVRKTWTEKFKSPDTVHFFRTMSGLSVLLRNLRSGGRYSGRQNVQVWSTFPQKKVRKTWTEKFKSPDTVHFFRTISVFTTKVQVGSRLGPGWVQVRAP
jgi:hypothetical protein